MTKKAWVENGIIRDICNSNPAEAYHPIVAADYDTDVPDFCVNGAELVGGVWINPVAPEVLMVSAPLPVLNPLQFKMLFALQERVLIKKARLTDDLLIEAFEILDDPLLTTVDLAHKTTIEMIDYLVHLGCISTERGAEIKLGTQV